VLRPRLPYHPGIRFISVLLATTALSEVLLLGAPRPQALDPESRINHWSQLLIEQREIYRVYPVALFEDQPHLKVISPATPLAVVKTVYKRAIEAAFNKETELINRFYPSSSRRSLFVHTSFEIPGQQNFQVEFKEPLKLKGRLLAVSLWVYSNDYPHRLVLLFNNQAGKKIEISAGNLNWLGWRRLEIRLPTHFFNPPRKISTAEGHSLIGFRIVSHPRSSAGDVSIMLDNILAFADRRTNSYPGAEFSDEW